MDAQLSSDVKSALMVKGWVAVPEGEGQAAVIVHVATTAEHTYDSFYRGWGGWNTRWSGSSNPAAFVEDYEPGTVVVTIFDADARQAVWRGFAADAASATSKAPAKRRDAAVARMFEKFPLMTVNTSAPLPVEGRRIIFAEAPALLIRIDGDPIYRDVAGTELQRVVNTKPLILRDEAGIYHLKMLDGWMEVRARGLVVGLRGCAGGCRRRASAGCRSEQRRLDGPSESAGRWRPASSHRWIGADRLRGYHPASLIVTDGPPRFAPIAGTSLEHREHDGERVQGTDRSRTLRVGIGALVSVVEDRRALAVCPGATSAARGLRPNPGQPPQILTI